MKKQPQISDSLHSSEHESQLKVRFVLHPKNQHQSKIGHSLLMKSHNVSKQSKYIKYDIQGNTSLVDEPHELDKEFSYRKVHLEEDNYDFGKNINWQRDLQSLNAHVKPKDKIIMRPLRRLYQRNYRPGFFTHINETKGFSFKYFNLQIPQCLYQMDHLSQSQIKSLFVTQDYSQQGLYKISINEDGRFRLITVNDQVPVYEQTNQHVWNIEEPWKMMLLKVWACLNEGYGGLLKQFVPFRFIEYFTSNNWKYYNLQREGLRWFTKFKDTADISYIILQTKMSQQVNKIGLVPGSSAYNIVHITDDPKHWVVFEVKSRFKHKWRGQLNIFNNQSQISKREDSTFRLQKNFLLTKTEFFEIFGCAYITSLSKSNSHITDYVKIQIPRLSRKAVYLKFTVQNLTFMDFSFIQSYKNKVPLQTSQSLIDHQKYNKQTGKDLKPQGKYRYLRCKYMLIKCLKRLTKDFESKLSTISKRRQPLLTSTAKYEAYDVQYLSGYNKGEAHFMIMQPGDYYLRLKSQNADKEAIYYLNYCSSQKLNVSEEIVWDKERQEIMQNCMLSILPACTQYKTSSCIIYSGDQFEQMGYGFVVVENVSYRERVISTFLFQVNLEELENEGYKLKGKKYKHSQQNSKIHLGNRENNIIAFQIKPLGHLVLIFKRLQSQGTRRYLWPPKSIDIFKAQDLKQLKKQTT